MATVYHKQNINKPRENLMGKRMKFQTLANEDSLIHSCKRHITRTHTWLPSALI
jgi:hypothetical protein